MARTLSAVREVSEESESCAENDKTEDKITQQLNTDGGLDCEINNLDAEVDDVGEIISHRNIWVEIDDQFNSERKAIEEYKDTKEPLVDIPQNPEISYLNKEVFPYVLIALGMTLEKARETDSLKYQKSTFNGIDFIAENLWKLNPRYTSRRDLRISIFDMDWAQEILRRHPRPYFPPSYVWSKDFAAKKIQAGYRAYRVRKTEDVQEMRQFWKIMRVERHLQSLEF